MLNGRVNNMNRIKMSESLLNFILMIQTYRLLKIRESEFNIQQGLPNADWYEETKKYYNSVDSSVLAQYGLSKNIASYMKILDYKITDEMMNTEVHEVSKFEF
jgi:hypothetical protein